MLKKVVLPAICLVSITTFVVANSFAWFTESNKKTPTINGSTPTAYYKSGDGTESNPYVIARPVHLYNFAWLQYMGTYNQVDDDGTVKQTYFKIDDDLTTDSNGNKVLDMKGYVLPPLGTEDNPFVGNFDGNGALITNLTISNKYGDYSRTPSSITSSNFDAPQVIGLFGVVGATDTSKAYEYSSTTDALVHDVYAENLTIKNDTSTNKQTLAGLLAGYVNAPILNCGVGLGTFDLASGTTSLGTYNGTTLKGVSDYALVGSYNSENFSWSIPDGGGSGSDTGWGGSIDISSLSKRVTFITNNSTLSAGKVDSYPTYKSSDFGISFYQVPNKYTWDYSEKSSGQYSALEEGTYLPLNVDTTTINETYYSTNKKEKILNSNTGYIVGYGESGNAGPRVTNKLTNASAKGIVYSLANQANSSDSDNRSVVFTQSNIALFYYDTINNTTSRIKDGYNSSTKFNTGPSGTVNLSDLNLQKYTNVKEQFIDMLDSGTSDTNMENKKVVLNGIQIFKLKSSNLKTLDATNVALNGKTYSSYQFYEAGFNFTLKSSGVVSMIVGCYTTSATHQLPQIFKLERDSDNKITSKTEIKTIYQDSTGIYYNDTNKGTTINLAAMTESQVLLQNCAYYIEVPLTAGDYYFASIDQGNNCPYLLYLDIGANAGDSGDDDDDTSPWPIDFVYFDSNKTLVKISTDKDSSGNYIYKNSEALFQINETASGIIKFKRKDGDGTVVYYYITSGSTITVVAIATEGKYEISTSNLTPIYTTSN